LKIYKFEDLLPVVLEEKVVIGIALHMDRLDAVVHERAQGINILFILGLSALITPIAYQPQFFVDSIMAIAATVILALLVLNKDHKLKRYGGIAMLVVYSIYLIYLLK